MNLPSIPFDKISKLLIFGGIILFISVLIADEKANREVDDLSEKREREMLSIEYKNNLAQFRIIQNRRELLETKQKNTIDSLNYQIKIDSLLVSNGDRLHSNLTTKISNSYTILGLDSNLRLFLFFIGFGLFLTGLILWDREIAQERKAANYKYNIDIKNFPCESCGMPLYNDFHPHMDQKLCSTCFDGSAYVEPDLSLTEMKERVGKKLNDLGASKKEIKNHLTLLNELNRWSKDLKW